MPTATGRPASPDKDRSGTATVTSPPPTPSRMVRYATPSVALEPFWTVTESNGCLPALSHVFSADMWWGEPSLPEPLNEYEALVARLPSILRPRDPVAGRSRLLEEVEALPPMCLFASRAQLSQRDLERSATPGHEHAPLCPNMSADLRPVVVLSSDAHRERAFAALAFLANAIVHSSPDTSSARILPRKVAEPLRHMAISVGRLPVSDYACTVLTNWTLIDPSQRFTLDNVRILRTFTGSEAEKWFYAIHACIEHRGGKALKSLLDAKEEVARLIMLQKLQIKGKAAMERGAALQSLLAHSKMFSVSSDDSALPSLSSSPGVANSGEARTAMIIVSQQLRNVGSALVDISDVMSRLSERCPPDIFFDEVRVFLASWPDAGVLYSSGCSEDCPGKARVMKMAGASGAQSSLFPAIDAFLGVSYAQSEVARTDLGDFIRMLKRFRESMPPLHRQMVAMFEASGNCRELVAAAEEIASSLPPGETLADFESILLQLKAAYNEVLEKLVLFRRSHADYASKYIKQMAKERMRVEAKGTGGSDFTTHLQRHIVDTKKSLYALVRQRGPSMQRVESLERIWGDVRP